MGRGGRHGQPGRKGRHGVDGPAVELALLAIDACCGALLLVTASRRSRPRGAAAKAAKALVPL
ncbi:MAG: hypothetical protein FJ293_14045, partial [Planctomycetes bacterium]|nr:hypothetical protein [Planctomycetota bacterium]